MTAEHLFFLNVLSDFLNQRETVVPEKLDFDQIPAMAKSHQVEGIIYDQLKNQIRPMLLSGLSQSYAASIFYYTNRRNQLQGIAQRMEKAEIEFFTVKGFHIAGCYPKPFLRTMGDCDIVVHEADKEQVHDIMLSLGYENHLKQDMEWTYFKDSLEFEIHHRLLYDETVNSDSSKRFCDAVWDYVRPMEGTQMELDMSYHFVYLLLHLKKHFLNAGIGIRPFMDLYAVARNVTLDLDWIDARLREMDMLPFSQICMTLCSRWFGGLLPFQTEMDEAFYETATQYILKNGIFGRENAENSENYRMNNLQKRGRFRMLLGSIFPPYRAMRYVEHYSFLNGRPWLLPAAWIYRFFLHLFRGRLGHGTKLLSSSFVETEKLESRKLMLEQWGLTE